MCRPNPWLFDDSKMSQLGFWTETHDQYHSAPAAAHVHEPRPFVT